MTIEVLDRAEISGENVIVEYSATEAALAALRQKYAGVVFDLTTTKGDKEARAARLELTTLRTSLEKKRKQFKAPALEFGKKIDSEAARVTTEILALEDPIDQQIKADEQRRADEKAERERIAAVRAQGFRDRIASIRAFVGKCNGITAERITNGITMVEQVDVSAAAFEEFAPEAETAKAETLASMRLILEETKRREEEAARVEAQRLENERVAAEQKKQADALAAQQAELNRKAQELAQAQAAISTAQTPPAVATTPAPAAKPVITVDGPFTSNTPAPQVDNSARIKLGEINSRIAPLSITAAGLAELGFHPAGKEGAATMFLESDYPRMCAAMAQRLTQAAELQPA